MDLVRREADRGAAAEFVALDIRGEAESPPNDREMLKESLFAAKELERDRRGDVNSSSTGVAGAYEKQTVPVRADDSPREHFHPSTPTAGGAKRRRSSRRVPGWRDPRKILFAFAALLMYCYFVKRTIAAIVQTQSLDETGNSLPSVSNPGKTMTISGSSVGTLILLYFTLSMGKMTGGQTDDQ